MLLVFVTLAYFFGSIPFGKIIGLRYGVDIQKCGSGNIGFSNCLRILGWKPALLVLLADITKGLFPVFLALHFLPLNQTIFVALSSVVGHIYPVWLKFKGGKGIATSLGVIIALNPTLAILAVLMWLSVVGITRLASLASMLMILLLFFLALFTSSNLVLLFIFLLFLCTWTHRENITRLITGKEAKF